jgi:hypothetical protein
MGKISSDLQKAMLMAKMKSKKGTSSSGSLIVIQSRCSECEYNDPRYDIDEFCGQCDGQSLFSPKGGETRTSEQNTYEQVMKLLPKLTFDEKKKIIHTLQDELGYTDILPGTDF